MDRMIRAHVQPRLPPVCTGIYVIRLGVPLHHHRVLQLRRFDRFARVSQLATREGGL